MAQKHLSQPPLPTSAPACGFSFGKRHVSMNLLQPELDLGTGPDNWESAGLHPTCRRRETAAPWHRRRNVGRHLHPLPLVEVSDVH